MKKWQEICESQIVSSEEAVSLVKTERNSSACKIGRYRGKQSRLAGYKKMSAAALWEIGEMLL